jgi:hypothetical protein
MSVHVAAPLSAEETLERWQLIQPPRSVDLLGHAVAQVRPYLDRQHNIHMRVRAFWAGISAARRMNAAVWDVLEHEFTELARKSGLTHDLGYHGEASVEHVIRWTRIPFSCKSPPF